VTVYILVLFVALRTCLYGAFLELTSPAVLSNNIMMYCCLRLVGLSLLSYSVCRHMVYTGRCTKPVT
jgi:hypothetical protein